MKDRQSGVPLSRRDFLRYVGSLVIDLGLGNQALTNHIPPEPDGSTKKASSRLKPAVGDPVVSWAATPARIPATEAGVSDVWGRRETLNQLGGLEVWQQSIFAGIYVSSQQEGQSRGYPYDAMDLEPTEIVPNLDPKTNQVVGFRITREGQQKLDGHIVPPFWMKNPSQAMQYGWMHRYKDRQALGLTSKELRQIGLNTNEVGAGIPGLFKGPVEGASFYWDQSEKLGKLKFQTVEERRQTKKGAAAQPAETPAAEPTSEAVTQLDWDNEKAVKNHFGLTDGGEVVVNNKGTYEVKPKKGNSSFTVTNPDGCWYDGYRTADTGGPVRPEYDDKRVGIPPHWTGQVEGASFYRCTQ